MKCRRGQVMRGTGGQRDIGIEEEGKVEKKYQVMQIENLLTFYKQDFYYIHLTYTYRRAHTHTHTTQSLKPSEKRMAQHSPGHSASLHPLISAERIERRKKGGYRVGARAEKRVESGERDSSRTDQESKQMKESKEETRRRMTWWKGEKEERMFASHLQWRRTDSHQTPAEWQSPSLSQVA